VLGSTNETTTVVDLKSQTIVRWRIPWPSDYVTDLAVFDVVEGVLAEDIERNDLAQPEAVTLADLPRRLGTYHGRRVRRWLEQLASPADGPLFGFRGPSAPYWEFRGERPSVALIAADAGPSSYVDRTTDPRGFASAGSGTTCGCSVRTRTRFVRWRRRGGRPSPEKTWRRHSAFAPPTC